MTFELTELENLLGDHKRWKRNDGYTFSLQNSEDVNEAYVLRLKFCEETKLNEQMEEQIWVLFFFLIK